MRNTGKPSEQRFLDIFKKLGKEVFIERIVDASEVRGRTGRMGFTRKAPADWVVTECGDMYYAEVKSTVNKDSFTKGSIKKSQRNAAKQQLAAGGEYFVFIHRLDTDDWYRVPINNLLRADKTVFRWNELESYRWELAYA